jgi:hypothetical protein
VAVQARGRIVHVAEAESIDPAAFAGLYASLTEGQA